MSDEERLRTLGLVGLGLVHELNSPLTTTALSLELLLERVQGADPALRDAIAENLARVRRMAQLVHRFRGLARGAPAEQVPVRLGETVARALQLARPALAELSTVQIESPGGSADAAVVQADPILLEHATLCLLINAAQAGQRVVVTTAPGPAIQVDDDGPGIDAPDEVTRLGYSRKDGGGMGVGLALVELVAHEAGAELTFGSSPLGGARVCLDFSS